MGRVLVILKIVFLYKRVLVVNNRMFIIMKDWIEKVIFFLLIKNVYI